MKQPEDVHTIDLLGERRRPGPKPTGRALSHSQRQVAYRERQQQLFTDWMEGNTEAGAEIATSYLASLLPQMIAVGSCHHVELICAALLYRAQCQWWEHNKSGLGGVGSTPEA